MEEYAGLSLAARLAFLDGTTLGDPAVPRAVIQDETSTALELVAAARGLIRLACESRDPAARETCAAWAIRAGKMLAAQENKTKHVIRVIEAIRAAVEQNILEVFPVVMDGIVEIALSPIIVAAEDGHGETYSAISSVLVAAADPGVSLRCVCSLGAVVKDMDETLPRICAASIALEAIALATPWSQVISAVLPFLFHRINYTIVSSEATAGGIGTLLGPASAAASTSASAAAMSAAAMSASAVSAAAGLSQAHQLHTTGELGPVSSSSATSLGIGATAEQQVQEVSQGLSVEEYRTLTRLLLRVLRKVSVYASESEFESCIDLLIKVYGNPFSPILARVSMSNLVPSVLCELAADIKRSRRIFSIPRFFTKAFLLFDNVCTRILLRSSATVRPTSMVGYLGEFLVLFASLIPTFKAPECEEPLSHYDLLIQLQNQSAGSFNQHLSAPVSSQRLFSDNLNGLDQETLFHANDSQNIDSPQNIFQPHDASPNYHIQSQSTPPTPTPPTASKFHKVLPVDQDTLHHLDAAIRSIWYRCVMFGFPAPGQWLPEWTHALRVISYFCPPLIPHHRFPFLFSDAHISELLIQPDPAQHSGIDFFGSQLWREFLTSVYPSHRLIFTECSLAQCLYLLSIHYLETMRATDGKISALPLYLDFESTSYPFIGPAVASIIQEAYRRFAFRFPETRPPPFIGRSDLVFPSESQTDTRTTFAPSDSNLISRPGKSATVTAATAAAAAATAAAAAVSAVSSPATNQNMFSPSPPFAAPVPSARSGRSATISASQHILPLPALSQLQHQQQSQANQQQQQQANQQIPLRMTRQRIEDEEVSSVLYALARPSQRARDTAADCIHNLIAKKSRFLRSPRCLAVLISLLEGLERSREMTIANDGTMKVPLRLPVDGTISRYIHLPAGPTEREAIIKRARDIASAWISTAHTLSPLDLELSSAIMRQSSFASVLSGLACGGADVVHAAVKYSEGVGYVDGMLRTLRLAKLPGDCHALVAQMLASELDAFQPIESPETLFPVSNPQHETEAATPVAFINIDDFRQSLLRAASFLSTHGPVKFHALLTSFVRAPWRMFTNAHITAGLEALGWILNSPLFDGRPTFRAAVITTILEQWNLKMQQGVGLFFTDYSPATSISELPPRRNPARPPEHADATPHEKVIEFLIGLLQTIEPSEESAFMLRSLVLSSLGKPERISMLCSSAGARVRLLQLGSQMLRLGMCSLPEANLLRNQLYRAAFAAFEHAPAWLLSRAGPEEVRKHVSCIDAFLADMYHDAIAISGYIPFSASADSLFAELTALPHFHRSFYPDRDGTFGAGSPDPSLGNSAGAGGGSGGGGGPGGPGALGPTPSFSGTSVPPFSSGAAPAPVTTAAAAGAAGAGAGAGSGTYPVFGHTAGSYSAAGVSASSSEDQSAAVSAAAATAAAASHGNNPSFSAANNSSSYNLPLDPSAGYVPDLVSRSSAYWTSWIRASCILLNMLFSADVERLVAWHSPIMGPEPLIGRALPASQLVALPTKTWESLIDFAWAWSPRLALRLHARWGYQSNVRFSLEALVRKHAAELCHDPLAALYLLSPGHIAERVSELVYLIHWAPLPLLSAMQLLIGSPAKVQIVSQYTMRCLEAQPAENVIPFLPQLVQALRWDETGNLEKYLLGVSLSSQRLAHQLLWILKAIGTEQDLPAINNSSDDAKGAFLRRAVSLRTRITSDMTPEQQRLYQEEFQFIKEMTSVAGVLKNEPDADRKSKAIEFIRRIKVPSSAYLPTKPNLRIEEVEYNTASVMPSHSRTPVMVHFKVRDMDNPNSEVRREALILKVNDDCRQDVLALQMIGFASWAWDSTSLPVQATSYAVVTTELEGGVIHVVPKSMSRDQVGKLTDGALLDFFVNSYGPADSETFQEARFQYILSMAAYAVLSYILQIKDRHNGNILIESHGRIVHIDFGFLFDISPGGNLKFERAPFKLTQESIDLMGGENSEPFRLFEEYCIKSFLVLRERVNDFVTMVELMSEAGLPCILPRTLKTLRSRFCPEGSERTAIAHMRSRVAESFAATSSYIYDSFQALQNGYEFAR